jgi:DNA-binding LacI/PurR family transcriptional regulator
MRRYSVSDRTVLRSLEDLRRAGWIVRKRGSGTYVADPSSRRAAGADSAARASVEHATIAGLTLGLGARSFYRTCIDELAVQAEAGGKSLVCQLAREETGDVEAQLLEALNPLGFVLFSYRLHPIAKRLLDRGHRVVVIGAPPAGIDPIVPTIYADHEMGGFLAAQHLIKLGHRRLAFCFTLPNYPLEETLRWQGHIRAVADAEARGTAIRHEVLRKARVASWWQSPESAAEYFGGPDSPTGIVAWNDNEAIQLISLLHRAGVRVPQDVSVIGFDGVREGQTSAPALTTVEQFVTRQMHLALDLLTRASSPPPTQSYIIVPTLTLRASCSGR